MGAMQEYSDQQNADLKKENEELKEELNIQKSEIKKLNMRIGILKIAIDASKGHYDLLKSKADEMYEALKSAINNIDGLGNGWNIDKAKQAIENYKK
jgi:predicted nuclease with TOPRIM domain